MYPLPPLTPSPTCVAKKKQRTCCHGRGIPSTWPVQATSSAPRLSSFPQSTPIIPSVLPAPAASALPAPLAAWRGANGCLQCANAAAKQPRVSTRGKGGSGASASSSPALDCCPVPAEGMEDDEVGAAAVVAEGEGVAWVCAACSKGGATCENAHARARGTCDVGCVWPKCTSSSACCGGMEGTCCRSARAHASHTRKSLRSSTRMCVRASKGVAPIRNPSVHVQGLHIAQGLNHA